MPRRSSRSRNAHSQRDAYDIARPLLRSNILEDLERFERASPSSTTLFDDFDLAEVEDRRQYHPLGKFRPVRSIHERSAARLFDRPPIAFARPSHLPVCIRRKRRKEVIFALKKAGKGARQRKRRRNETSDISCK